MPDPQENAPGASQTPDSTQPQAQTPDEHSPDPAMTHQEGDDRAAQAPAGNQDQPG